jgi:hypothetical protein
VSTETFDEIHEISVQLIELAPPIRPEEHAKLVEQYKIALLANELPKFLLHITQRPSETLYRLVFGGAYRVRALQELFQETQEERFASVRCVVLPTLTDLQLQTYQMLESTPEPNAQPTYEQNKVAPLIRREDHTKMADQYKDAIEKKQMIIVKKLGRLLGGKLPKLSDTQFRMFFPESTCDAIDQADPNDIESLRQVALTVIWDALGEVDHLQRRLQYDSSDFSRIGKKP